MNLKLHLKWFMAIIVVMFVCVMFGGYPKQQANYQYKKVLRWAHQASPINLITLERKKIRGWVGPCQFTIQLSLQNWTNGVWILSDHVTPVDVATAKCVESQDPHHIFSTLDVCKAIQNSLILTMAAVLHRTESKQWLTGVCATHRTPIQESIAMGDMAMVNLLVKNNYDTVIDEYNRTVRDYISLKGSPSSSWRQDDSDTSFGWEDSTQWYENKSSDIDIVDALNFKTYWRDYFIPGRPVLVRGFASKQENILFSKHNLGKKWADKKFKVGPVAYPGLTQQKSCTQQFSLEELQHPTSCREHPYIKSLYHAHHPRKNEIKSIFEQELPVSWKKVTDIVHIAAFSKQMFFGPDGSGATYHSHGGAFNILYVGRKEWLVAPPFNRGLSGAAAPHVFQMLHKRVSFRRIYQRAGDLIILPNLWGHMTRGHGFSMGVGNIFQPNRANTKTDQPKRDSMDQPKQDKTARAIYFVHVNKAGGSSIYEALHRYCNYKRPFHASAMMFQEQHANFQTAFAFGFVRNPFSRQVSNFFFLIDRCSKKTSFGCRQRFIPTQTPKDAVHSFHEWILKLYTHYPPTHPKNYLFGSLAHGNNRYPAFNATQASWFVNTQGSIDVGHIYRFENLQHDFETLKQDIPCLKPAVLGHKKKGTYRQRWQDFYKNEKILHIMQEVYAIDFEIFGYSLSIA